MENGREDLITKSKTFGHHLEKEEIFNDWSLVLIW
jgi:hypothetical protein